MPHAIPVIILLGPPGSGKGTQAVSLSRALNIPHISTGDIFRYNIKNQTPLGKKVKEYLDQGVLVPDSVTLEMLFHRVGEPDCEKGFLLDGVPRTIAQAESLQNYLQRLAHQLFVCNLHVTDNEVLKRITGRRTCPQCNKIYHIDANPPKVQGVCDSCSGSLVQRSDDTREVVETRLKAYYNQTKPVEDFYRNKAKVHDVDGSKSQEEVLASLLATMKGH